MASGMMAATPHSLDHLPGGSRVHPEQFAPLTDALVTQHAMYGSLGRSHIEDVASVVM
jgi:hypothetical protein